MAAVDSQQALRDDVRLLGTLLGETLVRQEGEELYQQVERVRASAKRARAGASTGTVQATTSGGTLFSNVVFQVTP